MIPDVSPAIRTPTQRTGLREGVLTKTGQEVKKPPPSPAIRFADFYSRFVDNPGEFRRGARYTEQILKISGYPAIDPDTVRIFFASLNRELRLSQRTHNPLTVERVMERKKGHELLGLISTSVRPRFSSIEKHLDKLTEGQKYGARSVLYLEEIQMSKNPGRHHVLRKVVVGARNSFSNLRGPPENH